MCAENNKRCFDEDITLLRKITFYTKLICQMLGRDRGHMCDSEGEPGEMTMVRRAASRLSPSGESSDES